MARFGGLRKQNRALAYREALFNKLEQQVRPLSVLGIVGQCAAACGGVTVDRLESAERSAQQTKSTDSKDTATNLISIKVKAHSSLPVAQLVLALREKQTFRKVELKGGDRMLSGQQPDSYTIECWF